MDTKNPPQISSTKIIPTQGTTLNKFVITVAPHSLICPQGRTYPINEIIIIINIIINPLTQTILWL